MVIEVLSQKYNTKSKAGIGFLKEPGILKRLNSIIEWPRCTFPSTIEVTTKLPPMPTLNENGDIVSGTEEIDTKVYLEDSKFLGDQPELKPSNTFLFRGQVIAVKSEDELVEVISETTRYGELALNRFLEDYIKPEEELRNKSSKPVSMEEVNEIPDNFSSYVNLPYSYHSAWKEMTEGSEKIWKCTVFPITLIFDDWKVRYSGDFFDEADEEYIKEQAKEMMAWIAQNKPNQTIHTPKTFDQVKQDYITSIGRTEKALQEIKDSGGFGEKGGD